MYIPLSVQRFLLGPDRAWDAAGNQFIVVQEETTSNNNAKVAVVYPVVNEKLDTAHSTRYPEIYGSPRITVDPQGMGYVFGADRDGGLHDFPIPGWKPRVVMPLDLAPPWINWGPPFASRAQATRLQNGLVVVEGVVRNGGMGTVANLTIARLPVRFRPQAQQPFVCVCGRSSGPGFDRVDVMADGTIVLVFPGLSPLNALSLNFSFLAT